MPTVREINDQLKKLQYRKTVLKWIADALDKNFLRSAGGEAIKTLLTDDKVRVPETAFDEVIADIVQSVKLCDEETAKLNNTELVEAPKVMPADELAPQGESK